MNLLIYPKIAFDSIRKNKKLYFPFIITCIGMVMMYYIVTFIQYSEALTYLPGSSIIYSMITLGGWIIVIFSTLFLFYTNTFLLKQRKKEFGLYSVLGMGKKDLILIALWESIYIALSSLTIGLLLGIALSKLAELTLLNIIHGDLNYVYEISTESVIKTLMIYGSIFLLLFVNELYQITTSSPLELINSERVGEVAPKGNILWALIGIGLLIGAYYISYTIEDPVSALAYFFLAVLMVIIGTYMLLISGSVFICRFLQKRENYYYQTSHFISVSSMVYRMKRNGAGLATICILSTMVLVMLSSTTSLYLGNEESANTRYPRDIDLTFISSSPTGFSEENLTTIKSIISEITDENKSGIENLNAYRSTMLNGILLKESGGNILTDLNTVTGDQLDELTRFYFIPLSDYNALTGSSETLAEGEVLLYPYRIPFDSSTLSFDNGTQFTVKEQLKDFEIDGDIAMRITPSVIVITPDQEYDLSRFRTSGTYPRLTDRYIYNFDSTLSPEEQIELYKDLYYAFDEGLFEDLGIENVLVESRENEKASFYSLTGGLFFLGALLSLVFIGATVLIIYYKQIAEGFEDRSRFEIMQKVGLTKKEIKRSINSQLLIVFFLPLLLAAVHIFFAFPILSKLLLLFNLDDQLLFALVTLMCIFIFGSFYLLVYKLTSSIYYQIVS